MRSLWQKLTLTIALLLVLGTTSAHLQAQSTVAKSDDAAIRSVLDAQVGAWNRGDIPAFMASYEDSEETTFIGKSVAHGFQPILERYKKSYSTREQMGTLNFSNLVIRLLPTSTGATEYAVVTGSFHLDRSAKGEATKDDGIFSLVWHKGPGGWKILLDHTSS
jgi:ketosteroid isomerase-like protein